MLIIAQNIPGKKQSPRINCRGIDTRHNWHKKARL